jgi:hypothetical protein
MFCASCILYESNYSFAFCPFGQTKRRPVESKTAPKMKAKTMDTKQFYLLEAKIFFKWELEIFKCRIRISFSSSINNKWTTKQ